MQISARLVTLLASLLVSYTAIRYLEAGYKSEMMAPQTPLAELKIVLDNWYGEDVPIDEEVDRVVDAHSSINRLYRMDNGTKTVSVHVAAFIDPIYRASAPHHPTVCYPAAGWEIIEREVVRFQVGGMEVPVGLIVFQRRGEQIVTAHWYNVGEEVFTGSEGMQSHFSKFWGSDSCPCIRKHLLQLPVTTIKEAVPILEDFVPKLVAEFRRLEI